MEILTNNQGKRKIIPILVVLVGVLMVILATLITLVLQLTTIQIIVFCWIITAVYLIWIILIIDPIININPIHRIIKEVPVEVEREVIRNVFVDRPVMVDREVIKEVPVEVEKTVYRTIATPHQNLNIPRYRFLGSTQTKTYHRRTCKFSKMLKNKFKEHSNSASFFKKKNYKACKTCIDIKKK